MPKVVIKSIETGDDSWNPIERTEVYVDGVLIGKGTYGGEPEDNSSIRDYDWVEDLLEKLATKLGADVIFEKTEGQ